MAKKRQQRKADRKRREALGFDPDTGAERDAEARAQHDTQVPESADVVEAHLAEQGADLDALKGKPGEEPPAESPSRRAEKEAEKERRRRAKESQARRQATPVTAEKRKRGRVMGFFASCVAELKRVQWPDRPTLVQATIVTIVFIALVGAYLGVLDLVFNRVVQYII